MAVRRHGRSAAGRLGWQGLWDGGTAGRQRIARQSGAAGRADLQERSGCWLGPWAGVKSESPSESFPSQPPRHLSPFRAISELFCSARHGGHFRVVLRRRWTGSRQGCCRFLLSIPAVDSVRLYIDPALVCSARLSPPWRIRLSPPWRIRAGAWAWRMGADFRHEAQTASRRIDRGVTLGRGGAGGGVALFRLSECVSRWRLSSRAMAGATRGY